MVESLDAPIEVGEVPFMMVVMARLRPSEIRPVLVRVRRIPPVVRVREDGRSRECGSDEQDGKRRQSDARSEEGRDHDAAISALTRAASARVGPNELTLEKRLWRLSLAMLAATSEPLFCFSPLAPKPYETDETEDGDVDGQPEQRIVVLHRDRFL